MIAIVQIAYLIVIVLILEVGSDPAAIYVLIITSNIGMCRNVIKATMNAVNPFFQRLYLSKP
jgi:hypothetical protein